MKAKKTIFVALIALAATLALGSCGNPNGADTTGKAYAGTYTSETNSTTLIINEDGTCSFTAGENGSVSASGTYVPSTDGNSATVTFGNVTLTATTTDGWATFKTTSTATDYNGMTFTKQ